ncbi:peptidoglycan-binding protein [Nocardia vinacea]|uniref:Peptidoglycan-binding protein n=1 Tax=Nocardia vinacea TaxID=96468 RepID=A0ABZ1YXN6_9NOCA|nr:peptidoglycan-binding domain-containing protein [Nocardia vinacea]
MRTFSAKAATLLTAVMVTSAGWAILGTGTAVAESRTCDQTAKVEKYGGKATVPSSNPWGPEDCTLREGSSGSAVKALQGALNSCYKAGLSVDGQFGGKTRAALVDAQRAAGAADDGIFGPNTRDRIKWMFSNDNLIGCRTL